MTILEHKYILFELFNFSKLAAFSLLCALHCMIHAHMLLPLVICTRFLTCCTWINLNEPILAHVLLEQQASKNIFVFFEVYFIVFSAQLILELSWVSQSIPKMTGALSSGTTQHHTICTAPEANDILSLAYFKLSTLCFFSNVTHIGSMLMVVACIACTSTALTKLCVAPESIKTVLQYTS